MRNIDKLTIGAAAVLVYGTMILVTAMQIQSAICFERKMKSPELDCRGLLQRIAAIVRTK